MALSLGGLPGFSDTDHFFSEAFRDADAFFQDVARRAPWTAGAGAQPQLGGTGAERLIFVDMFEDDKAFHVLAELPGLTKEAVKLELLANNTLRIRAEKEPSVKPPEGAKQHRDERRATGAAQGCFAPRAVRLPQSADVSKATAKMEHGVLSISVPKVAEKPKEAHTLPIE